MRSEKDFAGRALLTFVFLILMAGAATLLLASPLQASAAGGSKTVGQSGYVTVVGGSTGSTAAIASVIHNDYIVVVVGFVGTGQTVSTVTDTGSSSFTKVASSNVNEDVEVWCGQYTAASASDTVTVKSTASASYSFRAIFAAGLTSCSGATTETNSGTSGSPSVASFTPATGSFCEEATSDATGSSATWTDVNPFLYVSGGQTAPASALTSGTNYVVDAYRGAWNSNDGATTGALTPSASSSPKWDEVIACLATSSAGNEIYNAVGYRGGGRTATNTPNEGVNAVLKGDYLVQMTFVSGTAITVSSVSDAIGAGDTYTKVASSDIHNDVEIWIGQALATSVASGFQVTSTLTGSAANSAVFAMDIGSISSTTAQVFTNSGTGTTVTLPSFTPDPDDLCIEAANVNTGQASSTFTVPANQPLQNLGGGVVGTGTTMFGEIATRADWPSGVSSTGTVTPSVTSSPTWDVVVACFPGTVTVPLTCTMASGAAVATLSLSESSGNALSPGTVNCDGSSHNITVDPSTTLTATEPADGANTRDRFSGAVASTTDNTCASAASGSCSAWSLTNYEQLKNTFQISANAQSTFDSGLSAVTVSGTQAGSAATICNITVTVASSDSCSGIWSDYNAVATVPSTIGGAASSTQWLASSTSTAAITTSSNTFNFNYYKQLQNTYQASPLVPSTWDASGLSLDGSNAVVCTAVTSCSTSLTTSDTNDLIMAFCESNGGETGYSVSDTSSLTWHERGSVLTGPGTDVLEVFYAASPSKLTSDSVSCTNIPSGAHNVVVSVFGVNGANALTPFDPNVGLPNTNSASLTTSPSCTTTTSDANDLLFTFMAHGGNTITATPSGFTTIRTTAGSPSSYTGYDIVSSTQNSASESWTLNTTTYWLTWCDAIQGAVSGVAATGTSLGVAGQTVCVTGPTATGSSTAISCSGYADYNTAVTMGVLTVSANERWSTAAATFTDATGGNTHTASYYEQLQNTYQITPDAQATWDNGLSVQNAVGTLLGSPGQTICSITLPNGGGAQTCSGYADYNAAVVIGSATIAGAPANSQWLRSGACSFTQATGGNTNNCNFYKQWTETWRATANAQSTFDSGLSTSVSGTVLGVAGTSICTVSPTSGQATGMCSGYIDNSQAATFSTTMSGAGSNTQWKCGACSTALQTSGGNTLNVNYYKQLQDTYLASPFAPSTWNVASLSLDGHTAGTSCSAVTTCQSPALTTSDTNDVIVALCGSTSASTFTAPTDSAGVLSFSQRGTTYSANAARTQSVWYAIASGPLSSDKVSCNISSASANLYVTVLSVNGANIVSPFDPNNNLPNTNSATTATSGSCTFTTSNPVDFLFITNFQGGSGPAAPGGFSAIYAAGGEISVAYEVVSATQSGVVASWSADTSASWSDWCDAIQPASYLAVTGTSLGAAGQSICTTGSPISGSSTSASCSGFSDYDSPVTMSPLAVNANERWIPATSSYTDTTGGNTHTDNYYEQLRDSYEITAKAQSTFDSGLTFILTGTYLGMGSSTICSMTPASNATDTCVAWADYNLPVTLPSNPSGEASNTRWQAAGAASFTDSTGGNSHNVNYYKQLKNTYGITAKAQATFDAGLTFILTGSLTGTGGSTICALSPASNATDTCVAWADYNGAVSYPGSPSGAALGTRWSPAGTTSFTDTTGGNSHNVNYFKQLSNSYEITAVAQGTFDSGLTFQLTGTLLGSAGSVVCALSPASNATDTCVAWADYDTAVNFPANPSGQAPSSRWEPSGTTTFTQTTGANTNNVNYYKQWFNIFQATPTSPLTFDSSRTIAFTGTVLGVSGSTICTISPASGAGATSCSGYSDNGASVSFGTSAGGASHSYWGAATSSTGSIISGGNTENSNYYEELQNTYQVTPATPTTLSGSITFIIKAKILGVAASTVCTVSVPASPSPGPYSCTGYADYGAAVSFPQYSGNDPANVQWLYSGTTAFTDTTVGNSHNVNYYEELQNIYLASPVAPATFDGGITFAFTGTIAGTAGQAVCTVTVPASPVTGSYSCAGYADYDTAVLVPASSASNPANVRWELSGGSSFTDTTGGNAHAANYYKQLVNTYSFSPASPAVWDNAFSPAITGTYLGVPGQTICTASLTSGGGAASCSGYADFDMVVSFPSSIADGAHAQWTGVAPLSFTDTTGGNTRTASYYEQFAGLTFTADPSAPAAWDTALVITVTGTYLGSSTTVCTINTSGGGGSATCSGLIDAGTSVTFANAVVDGTNARWETGDATQTPTGGSTTTADYFLQLRDTYQATPSAQVTWDAGLTAPAVSGTSLGVGSSSICAITLTSGGGPASCSGWADYNLPVTLGSVSGAPAGSRWQARGATSFTDSGAGGQTYNVDYYKQYTLTVTGGNGIVYSVVSQTGDNYWDSGTSLTVSSNGAYDRVAGAGQRVSSYNIDGGANTAVATTGTVTTASMTMDAAHTVAFNSVAQYEVTLDTGATASLSGITSPTIPADDYWYDSGTSVTLTLNGVWDRTATTGERLVSYSVNGGAPTHAATTGTVDVLSALAIASPQSVTAVTTAQHLLTVSGGNGVAYSAAPPIMGDSGWYDSGTSLTVSSNGVYGRVAGTGQRVASWNLDGGANIFVATVGLVTTSPIAMSASHTVAFNSVTQYEVTLDAGAASSLSSMTSTAIPGDNYWYDSGTSVTFTGNGVFGRGAGTGTRATGWSIDTGSSTPVLMAGTFSVLLANVVAPHTIHVSTVTQYELTLDAGGSSALNSVTSPTIPSDYYWYDSGTSVTLSLNGAFGRAGGVGSRLTGYAINGGANTPVSSTGTVAVLTAFAITSAQSITTTTVNQYEVSLDGGAVSALDSITPPTISGDKYWYDSGTSVTLTLDGVYGRGAGTGTRLAGYSINGGANNPTSTLATVTVLSAVPITSPLSIVTTTVTQFQVTLDATTVSALSSITPPSVAGDNYWYDSGASVTVSLNGVWGRTLTTGSRLASYTINGGAPTNTATGGIVMVLSSVPIASPQSIASTSVTQFFLTVTGGNAIAYSVNPPITGDVGWYDSGTALTVSSDGVYGRAAGTGQRVSSWSIDGAPNSDVATTGTITTSSITMSAAHAVSFSSVTQYEVTLDSTSVAALSSCTAPSIPGDDYWYDSGTHLVTCSLHGVWGRSGGTGDRLTGYSVNGAPSTVVSTTGLVTPFSVANIASPQSIAATAVVQYMLTIAASPSAGGTVAYITHPAISGDTGWYDSGTTVVFSVAPNSGYIFGRWLGVGACSYTGGVTAPSMVMSCAASESASFAGEVRESISLESVSSSGLTPYFEITGCNPAPDSVPGDGSPVSVELDPSCSFTVSILNTGSTRYGFSVSGAFSSSSPSQQSCASGTCGALTLDYFEQVSEQFAYSIGDGSSGFAAPTLTCTQAGTTGSCGQLTTSPASFWLDYGSSWSASNPLGGSNGTVRWESSAATGLASESSITTTVVYSHQFLVAFQTNPEAGGLTSPTAGTSQWVDSGSSLSLSETPSSGFSFTSWASSSPTHVEFSDANAGSTIASIDGPGVITAQFNLALVAVTFTESGLPAGTIWSATVGGDNATADTPSLTFELPPATYSWTVSTLIAGQTSGVRFVASIASGTIIVNGPERQAISFLTQYYLTVSVGSSASDITLAPASGWYAAGSQLSLNASANPSAFLAFVSWTGTGAGSYSGPSAVAPVSMRGPVMETANFGREMGSVTFVESGLPNGTDWSVVVNGVNQTSQGDSITFGGIPVGSTVDWVVQSPTSAPGTGSLLVLSPQIITVTITFTTSPSTVTTTSTLITGSSSTTTVTVTSGTTTVVTTTPAAQGNNGLPVIIYPLLALVAVLAALLSIVSIRRSGNA